MAWDLVSGDIIENMGPIEPKGDPVEDLVDKIMEISLHPRQRVSDSIKRWYADGLLKYDLKSGHLTWRWS